MKHTLYAALLALLLALLPCAALGAEDAGSIHAQAFADMMAELDIACTLHPADGSGSTLVTLETDDSSIGLRYTLHIRFDAAGEAAVLSVPEVIAFERPQLDDVIRACNTLNCSFMYTRFIADERECTVTVSIDLLLGRQDVSDVVLEALERLQSILREAYPMLAPYGS